MLWLCVVIHKDVGDLCNKGSEVLLITFFIYILPIMWIILLILGVERDDYCAELKRLIITFYSRCFFMFFLNLIFN